MDEVRMVLSKESPVRQASLLALEAADTDGDGTLDFDEFLSVYLSPGPASSAIASALLNGAAPTSILTDEQRELAADFQMSEAELDSYLGIFQALDTNGDGTVKIAEVAELLLRSSNRVRDDEELLKWVREMDANDDGVLDLTEFLGVISSGTSPRLTAP